ncbi:membrane-associated protein, putative [Bodo saltans]|uniref:Membrane-associated protein, putative n=1 Tax=Bodo saltans TaxID=75058 RepID=A0A0S4IYP8_BODSA|nr:membrane-associated protein, putative [Bodo saltans]|eukprot:CUG11858.1 membrane-associated protein, putative [Bodo saltans]
MIHMFFADVTLRRLWLCSMMLAIASASSINQCYPPVGTSARNPSDNSRNVTIRWHAAPENDGSNTPRLYPTLICTQPTFKCSDFSAAGPMFLQQITLSNALNFSSVNFNATVQSTASLYSMNGFVLGEQSIMKIPTGGPTKVSSDGIGGENVNFMAYLYTVNAMIAPYDITVTAVFACMGAQVIRDPCQERDDSLSGFILQTEVVEETITDPVTNITSTSFFNTSSTISPQMFPLTIVQSGRALLRLRLNNTFRERNHRDDNTSTNATIPNDSSSGAGDDHARTFNTTVEHVLHVTLPYYADNTTSQFTLVGFAQGNAGVPGNYSIFCTNSSSCTVVINASYVAAGGAVEIDFTVQRPGCPASVYPSRQYTLYATSTPDPPAPTTASVATLNSIGKTTAGLMGVTAGLSILSGSTTAGSKSASVATIRRLLVCQSSDEPTNSVLGFGFGSPERYYMRGAVVGNTAVVAIVMTVVLTTSLVIAYLNRASLPIPTTCSVLTELFHVPSILFPASAAMIQPTAGAAITLVVIGDGGDIALGVLWLILGSAFVAYASRITVLGPFHGNLIVGGAVPLRMPKFINPDGKPWEYAKIWFSGRFRWSPEKAHKPWKRRHMFLFFESKYKWYPFLNEIFIPGFLGVVAGLVVDDDSVCMSQMIVLLLTNVLQLGLGVYFRPSLNLFDEMFLHTINGTSLLIIVLLIIAYLKNDDGGLTDDTENLLLLFTIMTMLKAFVDFVTLVMASKEIVARIRELFHRKVDLIVHGKNPDDASDVEDNVATNHHDGDGMMMEEVLMVNGKDRSPEASILGIDAHPPHSPPSSPRSPSGSVNGRFPTPPLQEKDIIEHDGASIALPSLSPRASVAADIDNELQYSAMGTPEKAFRPGLHLRNGADDLLATNVDHDSILFSHPSHSSGAQAMTAATRNSSVYEALW